VRVREEPRRAAECHINCFAVVNSNLKITFILFIEKQIFLCNNIKVDCDQLDLFENYEESVRKSLKKVRIKS
jgi:hypothetical protein